MITSQRVASFTRPADTAVYAAGDIMSASTTVGAALSFGATPGAGRSVLTRVMLQKSTSAAWTGGGTLLLFQGDPGALNDNAAAAIAYSDTLNYLGQVALTATNSAPSGVGALLVSDNILSAANQIQINDSNVGAGQLFGVLLAAGAYTPASAELFSIKLFFQQGGTFLTPDSRQETYSFVRPADTTAYTAGDYITASTTAGAASQVASFGNSRQVVTRVRVQKSTNNTTTSAMQVGLFSDTPGVVNDNAASALAYPQPHLQALLAVQTFAVPTGLAFAVSDNVLSQATPTVVPVGAHRSLNGTGLYAVLLANAAYTPGSQERFRVDVEFAQEAT